MKRIPSPKGMLALVCGITGAGVISRTLAYLFFYDAGIGYLKKGNVFSTIWGVVLALTVLFSVLTVIFRKHWLAATSDRVHTCTAIAKSSAIVSMAACLLGALYFILKLIGGDTRILVLAGAITCVISVYHYVTLASYGYVRQTVCLLTGYVVPVAFAFMIADMYFEMTVTLNNPDKVMFICSFMLFMVVQLFELRFMLRRAIPSLYVAFSILAVTVGAAASIPFVVSVFCNVYERIVMASAALMILALTVATFLRLIEFINVCKGSTGHGEISKEETVSNSPTDEAPAPSVKVDRGDEIKTVTEPREGEPAHPTDLSDEE